jgi:hypothetical protein
VDYPPRPLDVFKLILKVPFLLVVERMDSLPNYDGNIGPMFCWVVMMLFLEPENSPKFLDELRSCLVF